MPSSHESTSQPLSPATIRRVTLLRPLHWLRLGWQDMWQIGWPSILHGVLLAAFGLCIVSVAAVLWYLLPGAISGFLLIGPILATGLYVLSQKRERGERATWQHVIAAWRCGACNLVGLGLVLALVATLWVLVSAVLIALFLQDSINGFDDFLRHVVLSEGSNLFPIWAAMGGVVAALVFAATVVSAPMLLDRDTGLLCAVATSFNAVAENPAPMIVWAGLIMLATLFGLATLMLGFILVVPIIGHGTWHAYRDLVDATVLPPRVGVTTP
ncbi:MAG: DUF2189 domain-containing protein [Thiotrichales bacterium]